MTNLTPSEHLADYYKRLYEDTLKHLQITQKKLDKKRDKLKRSRDDTHEHAKEIADELLRADERFRRLPITINVSEGGVVNFCDMPASPLQTSSGPSSPHKEVSTAKRKLDL